MRKISMYTLSAAAAMLVSAAIPVTSLAAVSTYQIPFANGSAYVIGVGGQNCLPGNIGQNGNWGQNGGWGQNNNGNQNNGWGAGPVLPDNSLPQVTPPDFIFPTPELPGPELPDSSLPDNSLPDSPDSSLPDNSLPGEPDNPGTAPEAPGDTVPSDPDNGGSQDAFADAVVELVNAERAKAGLSPLSVHDGVAEAANKRAQEIKGTFSHTRPDGSNFSTVLTQAGISYRSVGENIAYGQNSPEAVMQSWMNSSGHRANILNRDFTSIGVGHYQDASGTDYWTQLFIK